MGDKGAFGWIILCAKLQFCKLPVLFTRNNVCFWAPYLFSSDALPKKLSNGPFSHSHISSQNQFSVKFECVEFIFTSYILFPYLQSRATKPSPPFPLTATRWQQIPPLTGKLACAVVLAHRMATVVVRAAWGAACHTSQDTSLLSHCTWPASHPLSKSSHEGDNKVLLRGLQHGITGL